MYFFFVLFCPVKMKEKNQKVVESVRLICLRASDLIILLIHYTDGKMSATEVKTEKESP